MNNKLFIIILICILSLITSFAYLEENTNAEKLPKNAKYLQEPVFNSKIYFYESDNEFKINVILVHGVGDDASDIWKGLVPVLEKQFHVIYFDLPGFGRSGKEDALYSPQNYAALIKWIRDRNPDKPMYLIGHSMGGAISLCYAGTYPQSLQRLILVDAAGILHRTAFTKNLAEAKVSELSRNKIFSDELDILSRFIETSLLMNEMQQILPKDLSPVLENSFLRRKLLSSPQKIASVSMIYSDFSKQIENINVPCFIIWGGKDPIAPLRTGKMLASNIQNSSLFIMPGLGHNPMIERPAEFNNLILKSLTAESVPNQEKKSQSLNIKSITLDNRENVIIEGDYKEIKINNCRNILIKNTNASAVKIKNSWVDMENISVNSSEVGMILEESIIEITGGVISGDTGISVSDSKVDIAGVKIEGKKAAVSSSSKSNSTIVFSVCRIRSPYNNKNIHDIIEITKENSL
ncbi:MAG: alpha/beta hydrolase [Spirochaetota bacterium]